MQGHNWTNPEDQGMLQAVQSKLDSLYCSLNVTGFNLILWANEKESHGFFTFFCLLYHSATFEFLCFSQKNNFHAEVLKLQDGQMYFQGCLEWIWKGAFITCSSYVVCFSNILIEELFLKHNVDFVFASGSWKADHNLRSIPQEFRNGWSVGLRLQSLLILNMS